MPCAAVLMADLGAAIFSRVPGGEGSNCTAVQLSASPWVPVGWWSRYYSLKAADLNPNDQNNLPIRMVHRSVVFVQWW